MNISLDSCKYITFPQAIFTHVKGVPPSSWIEKIATHDTDGSLLLLFFKALAFSSSTGPEIKSNVLPQIRDVPTVSGSYMPLFCGGFSEAVPEALETEPVRLKKSKVQSIINEQILRLFPVKRKEIAVSLQSEFEQAIEQYIQKEEEEEGEQQFALQSFCEKLIKSCNGTKVSSAILELLKKKGQSLMRLDLSLCSLDSTNLQKVLRCFPKLEELRLGNNSITVKGITAIFCFIPIKYLDLTAVTMFTSDVLNVLSSFPCSVLPSKKFPFVLVMSKHNITQLLNSGYAVVVTHYFLKEIDLQERQQKYSRCAQAFAGIAQMTKRTLFDEGFTVTYVPYESTLKIHSGKIADRTYVHVEVPSPFFELL